MVRGYQRETGVDWPILLDESQGLYHAYGMLRASWWQLLNPVALAKYIGLMLRGHRPGKMGKDVTQLGGNVLIDPQGIIRGHFVSNNPHDRPTVAQLLTIFDSHSQG